MSSLTPSETKRKMEAWAKRLDQCSALLQASKQSQASQAHNSVHPTYSDIFEDLDALEMKISSVSREITAVSSSLSTSSSVDTTMELGEGKGLTHSQSDMEVLKSPAHARPAPFMNSSASFVFNLALHPKAGRGIPRPPVQNQEETSQKISSPIPMAGNKRKAEDTDYPMVTEPTRASGGNGADARTRAGAARMKKSKRFAVTPAGWYLPEDNGLFVMGSVWNIEETSMVEDEEGSLLPVAQGEIQGLE